MATYIPFIGTKGRFKFKEPFNDELNDNTTYIVESVRTFNNLLDSGIDIYEMVYKPKGLTEEDYNNDLIDGKIVLVELMDEAGKYYTVPSNYIVSVPDINGVLYRDKMVAVDLGYLPDNYDFTEFKANLTDLVKSLIGVDVDVNVIDASPTIMMTIEQHKTNEAERLSVIQNEDNVYVRLQDCENKVSQASDIISSLELALQQLNSQ